jgi:hypothetical protein
MLSPTGTISNWHYLKKLEVAQHMRERWLALPAEPPKGTAAKNGRVDYDADGRGAPRAGSPRKQEVIGSNSISGLSSGPPDR